MRWILSQDDRIGEPYCPAFNNVSNAWRTLFQVLMGEIAPLLVESIARQGSFTPAIFFLSYVTLCHVLLLSSLLVALMLEVYTVDLERMVQTNASSRRV